MSREMPHFLRRIRSIYIPVEIEGVINELFWEQPKVELLDFDKSLLWSRIKNLRVWICSKQIKAHYNDTNLRL